jgi:hypothetical protein
MSQSESPNNDTDTEGDSQNLSGELDLQQDDPSEEVEELPPEPAAADEVADELPLEEEGITESNRARIGARWPEPILAWFDNVKKKSMRQYQWCKG